MGWISISSLKQMQLVQQFCPKVVRSIVQPYIQSCFAHSEVLLLTMLAYEDQAERARTIHITTSRIRRGSERGSCLRGSSWHRA